MNMMDGIAFVRGMEVYELLILLGLALAILLFGYRIKKVAFFIAWFILGYLAMQYFLPTLNELVPQIKNDEIYQTLLPFGGGAVMAMLGFSIEKLCVGGICFFLVMLITVTNFGNEMQTLAIGAVVGVLAAGVAVMMMKPATILATSVMGAYALTLALLTLVATLNGDFYWPMLIGFSAIGGIFQFLTTKQIS